jgi:antitoxin PrlF
MAGAIIPCSESTLTDRYQTTVPDPIRKVLGLNKRDRISYTIESDGKVTISRAQAPEQDPLLGKFLNFIARDIEQNPQHIQAINADLVERIRDLVDGVDLDLDAPLADEDE